VVTDHYRTRRSASPISVDRPQLADSAADPSPTTQQARAENSRLPGLARRPAGGAVPIGRDSRRPARPHPRRRGRPRRHQHSRTSQVPRTTRTALISRRGHARIRGCCSRGWSGRRTH
jgi:hypothetical protein